MVLKILRILKNGTEKDVNSLIIKKDNLNFKDEYGRTLLLIAIKRNFQDFAVKLINAGCDVNLCDDYGNYPIISAAKHNKIKIVLALIKANCDLNVKDKNDNTALYLSIKKDFEKVAIMLIQANCNLDFKFHSKNSLLLYLALLRNNENIFYELIESGFYIDSVCYNKYRDLICSTSIGKRIFIPSIINENEYIGAKNYIFKILQFKKQFYEKFKITPQRNYNRSKQKAMTLLLIGKELLKKNKLCGLNTIIKYILIPYFFL